MRGEFLPLFPLMISHKGIGESMYMYRFFIIICALLLLGSCGMGSETDSTSNIDIEYTNLSTAHTLEQEAANVAKKTLSKNDDITSVKAVNSAEDMIIAFEIHHLKRFNLKKIRKKIQKEMDKKFPDLNVVVSADKKIILELDRLEEEILSNALSKKELDKKIKELVKLDNEQT